MTFKTFIKEKESTIRVFVDLDGCVVNWNKGYTDALRRDPISAEKVGYDINSNNPHEYERLLIQYFINQGFPPNKARSAGKGKFWKIIQGDYDWWVNLEFMPDGKELVDTCHKLRTDGYLKELNILSSPSSDTVCEKGKRDWLVKNGIASYFDNIIIVKDKYKYSTGKSDILIDDTKGKIDDWESKGNGTGILHTSTIDTVKKIVSYI